MATATNIGITGIDASYYLTKDLNKSTEFYTKFFGSEPTLHIPNTVSEWTFGGGETFGLYQPEDANEWRPSGGVLFHVGDIAASVDASKSLGVTFEEHPMETPMCFMAFGQDPEGNNFILHQTK